MSLVDALGLADPTGVWMTSAACRGADPDLFFPDRGQPTGQAKAICAACPVTRQCLDYALANRIVFGVWGGTSERERRRLRLQLDLGRRRVDPETIPHGTLRRYRRGGCRCDGCRRANTTQRWRVRPDSGVAG